MGGGGGYKVYVNPNCCVEAVRALRGGGGGVQGLCESQLLCEGCESTTWGGGGGGGGGYKVYVNPNCCVKAVRALRGGGGGVQGGYKVCVEAVRSLRGGYKVYVNPTMC